MRSKSRIPKRSRHRGTRQEQVAYSRRYPASRYSKTNNPHRDQGLYPGSTMRTDSSAPYQVVGRMGRRHEPPGDWPMVLALPVRQICELARQRGIDTFLDLAHSIGLYDIPLRELGCDYAGLLSYKWMYSPYAAGALYIRKEHTIRTATGL